LKPENLRWFWDEYSSRGILTPTGAELLIKIMVSETYFFRKQPKEVQTRLFEMLNKTPRGDYFCRRVSGYADSVC
jgi:hypothetical protein